MTYSPNMDVIRRVAATKYIPRPRYDVDRHGEVLTEDSPDKKPWGFVGTDLRRLIGGKVRFCQSCGLKYPSGPLCGYCFALVRPIDAEDAAKENQ